MNEKRRLTEEEIELAKSVSILQYCQSIGFELVLKSNVYRHPGWNGLVVKRDGYEWKDFSGEDGGGNIKFVMWLQGQLTGKEPVWREVIEALLKATHYSVNLMQRCPTQSESARCCPEKKQFELPPASPHYRHLFAYLIKKRGIDPRILKGFVEEKAIYESQNTIRKGEDTYTFYNCTFVSYDNTGHPVGAALRGTASEAKRPFKGMVPGSNLHFGFKRGGSSHRLLYFESPIDLLSYMTLQKMRVNNYCEINHDHLLAGNGLREMAITQYLDNHPEIQEIYFCVDQDVVHKNGKRPGQDFCLQMKPILEIRFPGRFRCYKKKIGVGYKDWNDRLKSILGI